MPVVSSGRSATCPCFKQHIRLGVLALSALVTMIALTLAAAPEAEAARPLRLHPANPHYLEFRGKPTVLITSGEHYGAVLNLDFDYVTYLDTLKADGLNQTRTFSGVYMEDARSFNITNNTLAPKENRLICPWARSDTPGYANGGNKFDLTKWDDAYFRRLKDFVRQAGRRGIVVELVLFCPFYDDAMWNLSPMKADNNVNGVGKVGRNDVYALKDPALTEVQVAVTRKIVQELRDFDNLYYEICNEPYFGGVTLEWQKRISDTIVDAEKGFRYRHLIAQNIANNKAKIENPDPNVSIFNFHYARPPDAVEMNYGLNRVIGDDETGFDGSDDRPYRTEGWDFIIAGGGIYSNLDYSFSAGHERGDGVVKAPGGGGKTLRKQLRILKDFIHGFDFVRMAPMNAVIRGGVPEGATARALVEPGRQYALYVKGGAQANLVLDLPAGRYRAEWVNTKTGAVDKAESLNHKGGEVTLASPEYVEDIALRIKRARG